jgi:hypothetical protein
MDVDLGRSTPSCLPHLQSDGQELDLVEEVDGDVPCDLVAAFTRIPPNEQAGEKTRGRAEYDFRPG